MTPDLVVAGNLLLDDIVCPDGRTRMAEPGGAALYATLAAALWGARVACLSVVGNDYPRGTLDALAARGVDMAGARSIDRPSLRTWLLYEGDLRRVVHRLEGTSHEQVSPTFADLPGGWRAARAFHLAPMPFEFQERLLVELAGLGDAQLSLDPYELLTESSRARWLPVIARAHVFLPSEDDLRLPGAAADSAAALAELSSGRLRWCVLKRGERGGLLFDARVGRVRVWAPHAKQVVDPTGAGDAFAAGFLTAMLEGLEAESALQRGVVSASFAIEDWGAAGLLAATRAEADRRMAQWFPRAAVA